MANRELGKVGNLGNLGKIIPSFLISEFSILPYSQNRKLGFKNLGKEFPRFLRFLRFPSFRPGREKNTSFFKITVKYFVRNNINQPVKLFHVFKVLSSDAVNRKTKEHLSVF